MTLEWTSKKARVFRALGTVSLPLAIVFATPSMLLLTVLVFWLLSLMTTVALHRLFTHSSFRCSRPWQWVLGVLSCLPMTASPLQWSLRHGLHHVHSDTDLDPHKISIERGFAKSEGGIAGLDINKAKRFMRDPMHVMLHRYYSMVHVLWALACYIIGDVYAVYFGWVLPITLWMWIGPLHTRYSHRDGKPIDMHWLFAFVFLGEHLHSKHHDRPSDANLVTQPGQVDVGYLFIRMIQRV